jgi:glutamate decarboxylase
MVHINRVATTKEVEDAKEQFEKVSSIDLTADDEADDYTATVYGSKFAAEDLPRHEMPDKEMPPNVAYRLIKDDLSLDGNPTLNLASFVTTYMEEEAEKLMVCVYPQSSLTPSPNDHQPQ